MTTTSTTLYPSETVGKSGKTHARLRNVKDRLSLTLTPGYSVTDIVALFRLLHVKQARHEELEIELQDFDEKSPLTAQVISDLSALIQHLPLFTRITAVTSDMKSNSASLQNRLMSQHSEICSGAQLYLRNTNSQDVTLIKEAINPVSKILNFFRENVFTAWLFIIHRKIRGYFRRVSLQQKLLQQERVTPPKSPTNVRMADAPDEYIPVPDVNDTKTETEKNLKIGPEQERIVPPLKLAVVATPGTSIAETNGNRTTIESERNVSIHHFYKPAPHSAPTFEDSKEKIKSVSVLGNFNFGPYRYGDRKMTVIEGTPFYQSSGQRSKLPGTWFPFYGITKVDHEQVARWVIKPLSVLFKFHYDTQMDDYYPEPFLNALNEIDLPAKRKKSLLTRFSNLEFMMLSSKIGGGFWGSFAGKQIIALFKSNRLSVLNLPMNQVYKHVTKYVITSNTPHEFTSFQDVPTTSNRNEYISLINHTLVHHGASLSGLAHCPDDIPTLVTLQKNEKQFSALLASMRAGMDEKKSTDRDGKIEQLDILPTLTLAKRKARTIRSEATKTFSVLGYLKSDNTNLITVISDTPFYQSSGVNSSIPRTWLPFYGITDSRKILPTNGGSKPWISLPVWLIKPYDIAKIQRKKNKCYLEYYPRSFLRDIRKFFSSSNALIDLLDDLLSRCANFEYMMISSKMGGGFWDTQRGQKVTNLFKSQKRYVLNLPIHEIYDNIPKYSKASDAKLEFTDFKGEETHTALDEYVLSINVSLIKHGARVSKHAHIPEEVDNEPIILRDNKEQSDMFLSLAQKNIDKQDTRLSGVSASRRARRKKHTRS